MRWFSALVLCILLITTASAYTPVIDAGHGGFDGGAVASNGIIEASLNLEISLRTAMLLRLLGAEPVMIREIDSSLESVGSKGKTAKAQDIRRRVEIVNTTPNALLISIHQNKFSDSRYSGAHVFYRDDASKPLADAIQFVISTQIDTANHRVPQKVPSSVYLFKHAAVPAVLVECGFLSNAAELARLVTADYQKKLAVAVVCEFLKFR